MSIANGHAIGFEILYIAMQAGHVLDACISIKLLKISSLISWSLYRCKCSVKLGSVGRGGGGLRNGRDDQGKALPRCFKMFVEHRRRRARTRVLRDGDAIAPRVFRARDRGSGNASPVSLFQRRRGAPRRSSSRRGTMLCRGGSQARLCMPSVLSGCDSANPHLKQVIRRCQPPRGLGL